MSKKIRFDRFDQLNGSPAVPLIIKGLAELNNAGMLGDQLLVDDDHGAILATAYGHDLSIPVGALAYRDLTWCNNFWVSLVWVDPGYRRQGVYRKMFDQVVLLAKKRGRLKISLGLHKGNAASRAAAESFGLTMKSTNWECRL